MKKILCLAISFMLVFAMLSVAAHAVSTEVNQGISTDFYVLDEDSESLFHAFEPLPIDLEPQIIVTLNGEPINFDIPPQIIDDRTMVPMRAIFEALGAEVDWNEDTEMITAIRGHVIIVMQIGNLTVTIAELGGGVEEIQLDIPPVIIEERTMVPTRAVAESFGVTVDWNENTRTVILTYEPDEDETEIGDTEDELNGELDVVAPNNGGQASNPEDEISEPNNDEPAEFEGHPLVGMWTTYFFMRNDETGWIFNADGTGFRLIAGSRIDPNFRNDMTWELLTDSVVRIHERPYEGRAMVREFYFYISQTDIYDMTYDFDILTLRVADNRNNVAEYGRRPPIRQ